MVSFSESQIQKVNYVTVIITKDIHLNFITAYFHNNDWNDILTDHGDQILVSL